MADTIVDSKYRILESLPKVAGRQRYLASDLISSQTAILEYVPIEGWDRVASRWRDHWQPILRERAQRFAGFASIVPVHAIGSWTEGPYYVYSADDQFEGSDLAPLPDRSDFIHFLRDLVALVARGDHVLNLRPEYVDSRTGRLRILPGAYILPIELLARSGTRSPYAPPELRHAGFFDRVTDGYLLAAVLSTMAERSECEVPAWFGVLSHLQRLEPARRPTLVQTLAALEDGDGTWASEPTRRGVERLSDLRLENGSVPRSVLDAMDVGLGHLAESRSTALVLESSPDGDSLRALFFELRSHLALLAERPRIVWVDPLSAWEARDLAGGGSVILVPEAAPEDVELLPLERLATERFRPALWVIGSGRTKSDAEANERLAQLSRQLGAEVSVQRILVPGSTTNATVAAPASSAARHLLDLLSVLGVDATADMLRLALPQNEERLPEVLVELEQLGFVLRQFEAGGWWGSEPRLVVRILRPEVFEARRDALSPERREELHLLISHLLEGIDIRTLGQRLLRFNHLFAGGNWESAAAECVPLLKWVQKRGPEPLMRALQRRLVNSNLTQHVPAPQLIETLHALANWEAQRGRMDDGQAYFERAAERLFGLDAADAAALSLDSTCDLLLAHADLLERRGEVERALNLLQRALDRFDERLQVLERGRLLAEMAMCELLLGRLVAAEERCHVVLKLLDARRHPHEVAKTYNVLGTVRWKASRYDEAEQYLNSCLSLREKAGDRLGMARAFNNLGLLCRSMRRFPAALEFHQKSMEIRRELGDDEGVARNALNLAWVHFEMESWEHAEELASRAERSSQQLGSPRLRAKSLGLLGEIHLARERIPEARAALESAIDIARRIDDMEELFMDLRKMADLELRNGEVDRAESHLKEAERFLSQAASPLEEAHWSRCYAEVWRARGDLRAAALAYENAGNTMARLNHSTRAATLFLAATQCYRDSGLTARARELVARARQLYERESAIVPPALVQFEVLLGSESTQLPGAPLAVRYVEALCRITAILANANGDSSAADRVLAEMRQIADAERVHLLQRDGQLRRGASAAGAPDTGSSDLMDDPRFVARALQTLLPFGSGDLVEAVEQPFLVIPVEANGHSQGSLVLEWARGASGPEDALVQVLRAIAQQLALVLDRSEPGGLRAAVVERTTKLSAPTTGPEPPGLEAVVGKSAARQVVVEFVRQVRDLDATVLLTGESGTGKEVVSRAIHFTGVRRGHEFNSINCTAIPEALWERELFGNERGAFTDAREAKPGYFERTHRGTLLLDEIGDMPWEMQTKFLRVLEEKSFTRIGGTESVHVDVRIIAATNQDLEAAVEAGRFRRDLYHRLNVLSLKLPPLRERREDIPELAAHFLETHASRMGVRPKRLSGEALRILMRYSWQGNVRELENAMKGSLVLSDRDVLMPEDLPVAVLRGGENREVTGDLDLDSVAKWILDHAAYSVRAPLMRGLERALARQMVQKMGEKTVAARLLGISKPTIYERIRPDAPR